MDEKQNHTTSENQAWSEEIAVVDQNGELLVARGRYFV